jgi:hypothetical protein
MGRDNTVDVSNSWGFYIEVPTPSNFTDPQK